MEREISKKSVLKQQMKEAQKNLIKEINETNAREWKKITDKYEGVYVLRSGFNDEDFSELKIKIRKMTIVGLVKKIADNDYQLQIGWSKCHTLDNFSRKVGNLIAAKRADALDSGFEFNGIVGVKPLVLGGFNTPILKDQFVRIASMLIDLYEDAIVKKNGRLITGPGESFLVKQANLFKNFKKEVIDADAEEIKD